MKKEYTIKDFLTFIRNVSTTLLESGSDTCMVEDYISSIITSENYCEPNIYVTSTGIFYSFSDNLNVYSDTIRVKKRGINLEKIDLINKLLLDLKNKKISFNNAIKECNIINSNIRKNKSLKIIAAGLSTAFFALLFNGKISDLIVSFICGCLIMLITLSFKRSNIFHFANSFTGALLTAIIGIIFSKLLNFSSHDVVITSSIMLLVPGLALTNSIKDTLTGNLVSGISRFSEVIIIAIAIASAIGIVFVTYSNLGGVL